MGSLDPLELDVISADPAIENESMVLNGAKQRRPLLALCVVALLGFIGWQVFSSGEQNGTNDSSASETSDEGAPQVVGDIDESPLGDPVEPPTTEYEAFEEPPDLEGDESVIGGSIETTRDETRDDETAESVEPAFPLFPDRPGLTLALVDPAGEVLLIDADDGSTTVLPTSVSASTPSTRYQVRRSGRVGETLVIQDGSNVVGYPLDGGPKIDFGFADLFALTDDLVVLQRWSDGPGGALQFQVLQFRAFQSDGQAAGDWVEAPNDNIWMNPDGFVVAPGGTYRFGGSGFERVSPHAIVGAGPNHVVELRCDAVLDCSYHRIEGRTGRAEAVILDRNPAWSQPSISPDGKWIGFFSWGPRDPNMVVTNLETGQEFLLSSSTAFDGAVEPSAPSWDSTGRYAVAGSLTGRGLTVFDAETRQVRDIGRDDLGLDFILSHLVVVDLADG